MIDNELKLNTSVTLEGHYCLSFRLPSRLGLVFRVLAEQLMYSVKVYTLYVTFACMLLYNNHQALVVLHTFWS